MSRRIIGSLAGALAAASLLAPVAQAGSPAHVSVRVEAPGRTIADTTLTTSSAAVKPDGTDVCSGTSAGGALWKAVPSHWSGTYYASFGDFTVDAIDGVRGAANGSTYWAFWLNGVVSSKGVCGTQLQAGDKVLEFLCSATPDFSSCTNLPLDLSVVDVRGGKATVKVVLLDGAGRSTPVAGATVRGGTAPAVTKADGRATVTLRQGQSALRATHAGDTPSGSLHCQRGARRARCGGSDTTPPTLALKGIVNGQAFTAARAPRVLHGTAVDPSGATVTLWLTRRAGGRCTRFDASRGAFRPCTVAPHAPFAAGDRAHWSYLLPAKLGKGSYRLDVIATDGAGNRRALSVAFTVGS
ncbi:MAG TPA: DUF4430 domain-containing protein [Conexibacter sp.]|nr:DUF4430 domain-containing protein [Conexibacter sp.]